jgi:hypothetical protein
VRRPLRRVVAPVPHRRSREVVPSLGVKSTNSVGAPVLPGGKHARSVARVSSVACCARLVRMPSRDLIPQSGITYPIVVSAWAALKSCLPPLDPTSSVWLRVFRFLPERWSSLESPWLPLFRLGPQLKIQETSLPRRAPRDWFQPASVARPSSSGWSPARSVDELSHAAGAAGRWCSLWCPSAVEL